MCLSGSSSGHKLGACEAIKDGSGLSNIQTSSSMPSYTAEARKLKSHIFPDSYADRILDVILVQPISCNYIMCDFQTEPNGKEVACKTSILLVRVWSQ